MDARTRFQTIVGTILQVPADRVTDDLSPDTIDTWDSLNHISLIGALEQEFGLTLATESLDKSQSIPALRALLAEHGIEV